MRICEGRKAVHPVPVLIYSFYVCMMYDKNLSTILGIYILCTGTSEICMSVCIYIPYYVNM